MRLVVVSGVIHYRHQGDLWAYGPYVREIEMWADLFSELRLAAACREQQPPGDCLRIRRANVSIAPKLEAGGRDAFHKLSYLWKLPILIWQLVGDFVRADAVHIRCPANLALLGAILAPLFSRRLVAKYAGQWTPYPGEPLTVKLQRALLASRWWRGPVTVYGEWPSQPAHVIPFFTSAMNETQIASARACSVRKRFDGRLRVLYVGRLSRPKNVDVLLQALAQANAAGSGLTCTVAGTGSELGSLRQLVANLGIEKYVEFTGGIGYERVLDQFERSHILVLVSESEGWPKALVEAMTYGLLCIGSKRGLIPQLLGNGRGLVVSPGDVAATASLLSRVAADPLTYVPMSRAAAAWAQGFSLERLRDELRALIEGVWGCRLSEHLREPPARVGKKDAPNHTP